MGEVIELEETGIVLSIEKKNALVRFERTEACKKCGACDMGKDGEMSMRILNTVGAQTGDRIVVELPEGTVLKASFFAYALPLALMLAGLFGGYALGGALSLSSDLAALVGALAGIALGFLVNRLLEPFRQKTSNYQPRAVRVVNE